MADSSTTKIQRTIYLVGGTSEANSAALRLQEGGYRIVISVATPTGGEVAEAAGFNAEVGGKDAAAMEDRARGLEAVAIVDCSHPFAREASNQASQAAAAAGLPYLRYTRAPVAGLEYMAGGDCSEGWPGQGRPAVVSGITGTDNAACPVITVPTFEAAAEQLSQIGGRSLLTLGTRHLETFVRAGLDFAVRILPITESLADCVRLGVEPRNIVAAWPPYSADFNRACLRKVGASVIVTKDSGREGGLMEKLEAANAEGVRTIVVQRPHEPDAIHDLDELVSTLDSRLNSKS